MADTIQPENKYDLVFKFLKSLYTEVYEHDYEALSEDELEQLEISKNEIAEGNPIPWETARKQLMELP
ncbi:MAG: hypothetical protein FWF87_05435 [Synergistaceae bacterium]|nr:hypothetical protein [Synergistaceae bacterium]